MEMPSRYYFIALGFLKYVEDSTRCKIVTIDTPDPNICRQKIESVTVSSETHVKMLEELFKAIKQSNEYL